LCCEAVAVKICVNYFARSCLAGVRDEIRKNSPPSSSDYAGKRQFCRCFSMKPRHFNITLLLAAVLLLWFETEFVIIAASSDRFKHRLFAAAWSWKGSFVALRTIVPVCWVAFNFKHLLRYRECRDI